MTTPVAHRTTASIASGQKKARPRAGRNSRAESAERPGVCWESGASVDGGGRGAAEHGQIRRRKPRRKAGARQSKYDQKPQIPGTAAVARQSRLRKDTEQVIAEVNKHGGDRGTRHVQHQRQKHPRKQVNRQSGRSKCRKAKNSELTAIAYRMPFSSYSAHRMP